MVLLEGQVFLVAGVVSLLLGSSSERTKSYLLKKPPRDFPSGIGTKWHRVCHKGCWETIKHRNEKMAGKSTVIWGTLGSRESPLECSNDVCHSSHSLHYVHTSVSEPGQQMPQFFSVGYVDDQQFVYYNVSTRRRLPKAPWITKVDKDDPQYWERTTQYVRNTEDIFRVDLVTLLNYYNQSGGFHTWQWMYGCELRKDGSKGGYMQYAYDGKDYISLDKETLTWTAADVQAQNTKRKWDAKPAIAQCYKAYLEEGCIEWLQRYLEYGKETLLRTDPPEVKVTRKAGYDNMETLICRVDGFYPKDIDISWRKDGKDWMGDTFSGLVSPNSDGTYYKWLSVEIDPKDRERYKCHVEHDGLPEPVDLAWEEPASNLGLIIACVVSAVLLVAGIVWIAMYIKKCQCGYKATSVNDQGSNSPGSGSAVPI